MKRLRGSSWPQHFRFQLQAAAVARCIAIDGDGCASLASLLAGPGYLAAICIHYYHLYADSVSMLSWNKGGRNKNQIYFILLYNREYNLNIALAGVMMQSVITTLICRCTLHLHTIYTRSAAMQANFNEMF